MIMYIAMGYEYLNLDQELCVKVLLNRISLNQSAMCKISHYRSDPGTAAVASNLSTTGCSR